MAEDMTAGADLFGTYILQDENGNEREFRLIDFLKEGDKLYFALVSAEAGAAVMQGGCELVVLAVQPGANGVDELTNIDDPDEYDRIQAVFLQRLAEELDAMPDEDDLDDEADE